MNRLYLIRHAQTRVDPNRHHSEWELDPAGEPLLKQLAALSHWRNAHRIVSSSEPKAVKTAEVIARLHQLPPVETLDALGELHKGSFVSDHDEAMGTLFRFPDRPVSEGWETAKSALSRFSGAVTRLLQSAMGRDVVVVSHGTVLSLYTAHLAGQSRVNPADWAAVGMPDYCVVDTETMRMVQPFGAWRTA